MHARRPSPLVPGRPATTRINNHLRRPSVLAAPSPTRARRLPEKQAFGRLRVVLGQARLMQNRPPSQAELARKFRPFPRGGPHPRLHPRERRGLGFLSLSIHTRIRAALSTPLLSPANGSRRPVASWARRRRASSPRRADRDDDQQLAPAA